MIALVSTEIALVNWKDPNIVADKDEFIRIEVLNHSPA